MKKFIFAALVAVCLTSCGSAVQSETSQDSVAVDSVAVVDVVADTLVVDTVAE